MVELKDNTPVKVSSPDNFRGMKLGFYLGKCKKDGGYRVFLTDDTAPVRYLCIIEEHGDTIESIAKK